MIKIIADKASDITAETARELDIEILPFMIAVDGKEIVADVDLSAEEFYEIVENCEGIPTTSQMSPSDLEDIYRRIGKDTTIIHITMSAAASGVNNTANMVAAGLREEGFDITVIDSAMLAMPIGYAVIKAAEMARDGASKEEILDTVADIYAHWNAYFLVDDLTFLKKGGRVKATTVTISKVLDIKPIMTISDGLVEVFKKVRGLKKAISALVDFAEERMENPQEGEIMILDSDAPDKVEILEQMLKERIKPAKISYAKIGPVITSHIGTGLVAVYFRHKKPFAEYENK